MKRLISALLCALPIMAFAARIPFFVTAPTLNTDTTPLTDLAKLRIDYGTCVDTSLTLTNAAVAKVIGSVVVPWTKTGAVATINVSPSQLNPVCAVAYAINAAGALSDPTLPFKKVLPGPPATPTQLPTPGQPIPVSPKP